MKLLPSALEMATKEKKERNYCWCRLKKKAAMQESREDEEKGEGKENRQQDRRLMRHQLNRNVALIAETRKK